MIPRRFILPLFAISAICAERRILRFCAKFLWRPEEIICRSLLNFVRISLHPHVFLWFHAKREIFLLSRTVKQQLLQERLWFYSWFHGGIADSVPANGCTFPRKGMSRRFSVKSWRYAFKQSSRTLQSILSFQWQILQSVCPSWNPPPSWEYVPALF